MIAISKELQKAVQESKDNIVYLIDPDTDKKYILLPEDDYNEKQSNYHYDDSPVTEEEQIALLVEMGLSIGWDDPEMDVYNELDPRRNNVSRKCGINVK